MAKRVLADLDFGGVSRILDLLDAVDPQEPATKAQLDAAVEGLNWKDEARVSTQGNINLASPGSTIDGVTMSAGDRVLVRAQTDAEDNGIYIWSAGASPMTRAMDASTWEELRQATVSVAEGTDEHTTWRQTSVTGTLGTDDIVWTAFGTTAPPASETTAGLIEIATQTEVNTGTDAVRAVTPATLAGYTGALRKYATNVGDNSNTSFTITHNLGSRDVIVQVYEAAGDFADVICEIERTSTTQCELIFSDAPGTNEFRVVVTG